MKNPKNILITGASSGIGEALSLFYAEAGRTMFLCARNEERLNAVAERCRQKGASVYAKVLDVTDEASMRDWILTATKLRRWIWLSRMRVFLRVPAVPKAKPKLKRGKFFQ